MPPFRRVGLPGRPSLLSPAAAAGRRAWPRNGYAITGVTVAILHITQFSLPEITSGYTLRTHAIATGQRARGLDLVVLTSPRHPSAQEAILDGVPYLRCHPERGGESLWRRDLRRVRELAACILDIASSRGDIALVHAHSPVICGLAALRAAGRLDVPVVYEVRGMWEQAIVEHARLRSLDLRYRVARALEMRVCHRANAVVAICEGLRRHLVGRGLPASRVQLMPNGVDTGVFAPRAATAASARALGIGDGPLVLYLGAIRRYEGLEVLLDAWPSVAARVADARLVVVGEGEERARIAARVQLLSPAAMMLPPVAHGAVGDYYAAAELVVYPRLSTPATEAVTPLKPLEAMAMAKAIVASDVGGLRELLADGETARLVPPGSAPALAEACVRLLSDPEQRRRLGANARARVVGHHQWVQIVERYLDLYRSLGVAADGVSSRA
mgnify:CR=1 FL=1